MFSRRGRIEMWVNYCTSLSRALMSVRFLVCVSMETTVSLLASRRIVISPSALGSPAIRKTPVLFSRYACAYFVCFICFFRQRVTCCCKKKKKGRKITVSFNNVWNDEGRGNTEEFKLCYVHTDNGTDCGIFTDEEGLGRSSTNQEASII